MTLKFLLLTTWLALIFLVNADHQSDFQVRKSLVKRAAILKADDKTSVKAMDPSAKKQLKFRANVGYGGGMASGTPPDGDHSHDEVSTFYKQQPPPPPRCRNGRCKGGSRGRGGEDDGGDPLSNREIRKFLRKLMHAARHFNDKADDDKEDESNNNNEKDPSKSQSGKPFGNRPIGSRPSGGTNTTALGNGRPNHKEESGSGNEMESGSEFESGGEAGSVENETENAEEEGNKAVEVGAGSESVGRGLVADNNNRNAIGIGADPKAAEQQVGVSRKALPEASGQAGNGRALGRGLQQVGASGIALGTGSGAMRAKPAPARRVEATTGAGGAAENVNRN